MKGWLRRLDAYMVGLCERRFGWTRCHHWKANLLLAFGSAVVTAVALRWMSGTLLLLLPIDSWAGQIAVTLWMTSDGLFYTSTGLAALGGATSLLREIRADPKAWSILGALGHMFAAQFAGLMAFVGCMWFEVSEWAALAVVGMAGWAGNEWLVRFDKWTSRRVFSGMDE